MEDEPRFVQRLHDIEQAEHAKTAKIEQAAVGPVLAVSGVRVLLAKGVAGARVEPVAESRDQLAWGRNREGKKVRGQELPIGTDGTKPGQREERVGKTGVVSFALLSAIAGFVGSDHTDC